MNNSYCIEWEKLNVAVVNTEYSFKYCRKETRTANILTNGNALLLIIKSMNL